MDAACRRESWTVQHNRLVLHSNVDEAIRLLQEDAAAVRAHVRREYGKYLQSGEYSVHVQVSWLGANSHYDVESQVRSPAKSTACCDFFLCLSSVPHTLMDVGTRLRNSSFF
jgi:hypothetical protein